MYIFNCVAIVVFLSLGRGAVLPFARCTKRSLRCSCNLLCISNVYRPTDPGTIPAGFRSVTVYSQSCRTTEPPNCTIPFDPFTSEVV